MKEKIYRNIWRLSLIEEDNTLYANAIKTGKSYIGFNTMAKEWKNLGIVAISKKDNRSLKINVTNQGKKILKLISELNLILKFENLDILKEVEKFEKKKETKYKKKKR